MKPLLRFFSEDKYYAKDFLRPTPNIDEPKREPGMELALIGVCSTVSIHAFEYI